MALDGETSFLRFLDVTNTCKRMRRGLSIGGSSSVQRRKFGRSWRLQICFRRLLCNKIGIRGAFGKFLAWSFISVTDLQNLSCLVSF